MSDASVTVHLPRFENPEADENFRKHVLALSVTICAAVNKYLENSTNQVPDAYSIGAACYVASYLIGVNFPDERKTQVADGLTACLALNDSNCSLSLANLPPQTEH